MPDLLNQDKQRHEIDEENRRQHQRELSDLQKIISMAEGRRFLWKLLSLAGIFRSSLSQNAMATQALEGARNLGLQLLNEINETDISAFARMQQEYLSEQKKKNEAEKTKEE